MSLCCHWFLCLLTSLISPRSELEKWDMLRWVGNMTYLPTHSDKLSHVSCRFISSLVDLFHLTRQAFKYTEIIHGSLNHAITLACLHTMIFFVNNHFDLKYSAGDVEANICPLITSCLKNHSCSCKEMLEWQGKSRVCGRTKMSFINVHTHFAALHIWPHCIIFTVILEARQGIWWGYSEDRHLVDG